jgi:hypothetical protein
LTIFFSLAIVTKTGLQRAISRAYCLFLSLDILRLISISWTTCISSICPTVGVMVAMALGDFFD